MTTLPKDRLSPEVRKAIERAERDDDVMYGAGVLSGEPVFVDVTLYPKRQWWLVTRGSRCAITKQEARKVERIKL